MIRAFAVTICLAILVLPARARPFDAQAKRVRELQLYDAGKAHYDIAEYALAVAKWKEAYLISYEPLLLFNIAQAYRLAGDCAQANRFYGNYQRMVPKPANQAELEIALDKCKGVPPATVDTTTPTTATGPSTASSSAEIATTSSSEVSTRPRTAGRRPLRLAGYALLGGGVLAGIAAGVFAMSARSDAKVVAAQPVGSPWTQELADTERGGLASERRAKIVTVVAVVAVVGGGVLWWLGRERAAMRVEVAVTRDHAELGLACAF